MARRALLRRRPIPSQGIISYDTKPRLAGVSYFWTYMILTASTIQQAVGCSAAVAAQWAWVGSESRAKLLARRLRRKWARATSSARVTASITPLRGSHPGRARPGIRRCDWHCCPMGEAWARRNIANQISIASRMTGLFTLHSPPWTHGAYGSRHGGESPIQTARQQAGRSLVGQPSTQQ